MDIRQRKIIPNGALAIILHTCEFPQGNLWARQISLTALDALTPKDYFGLLIYKNGVDKWGIPMTPVDDKSALSAQINTMSPEDMLLVSAFHAVGLCRIDGDRRPVSAHDHHF